MLKLDEYEQLYSQEMAAMPSKTPVSVLQELLSRRGITPKYELVQIEGAIHEPIFRYRVFLSSELVATGTGRSKKDAKHAAAKNLLDLLVGKQTPEQANQTNGTPGATDITSQVVSPYDDKVMGNPIGWLQEMCMSRRWPPPSYEMEHEEGLPHERQFTIACQVLKFREVGTGKSKKLAKRMAAHKMWQALQDLPLEGNSLPQGFESDEDLSTKLNNIQSRYIGLKDSKITKLGTQQSNKVSQFHRTLKNSSGKKLAELQALQKLHRISPNVTRNIQSTYPNLKKYIVQNSSLVQNARQFASNPNSMKVAVIGAAGKIGQALCLMLKQSPLIDELCVHDIKPTSGIAMELEHIDTHCKITAFTGKDSVGHALLDSKVVVILAAGEDTDVLPFDRMWAANAHIVKEVVALMVKNCPRAFLVIGTNPINSIVPMACEVLKKSGCYNPKAIFGMTTLDTVRANTFVAQVQGLEPECVMVPVIGGHTEDTIVPVLSKAKPCSEFTNEELESITVSIRKAHENILKLKPPESAPLSGAFASARFVISLVKAIRGYPDIMECAYVNSKAHPQLKYLSTPLLLGPSGITKNLGIPPLSDFETCMLDNAIPILVREIKRGEKFAGVIEPPPCDICDPNPNAQRCPANWCDIKN